jgi:hypothetical protein
MKTIRLALLAAPVVLSAVLAAQTAAPPQAGAASDQKEIPQWRGQYGGYPEFTTRVLRGTEAWEGFWTQVRRDLPRRLDPATEMAVAVFIGERRTGGYLVQIISAGVEKDGFVVVYEEQAPGPDKFVTQAFTTPWVVAVVPLSDRPVVFQAKQK